MTLPILTLCALCLLCEYGEKKCRKYYKDQWFLRASGACFGAAVVVLIWGLS